MTTPTIYAQVDDTGTAQAWTNTEVVGSSATADVSFGNQSLNPAVLPSGSFTATFFDNDTCTGAPSQADTMAIPSNYGQWYGTASGEAWLSVASVGALDPGSYALQVSYSGDANYSPVSSQCLPFSVAP
jgi:hypothetical protein